MALRFDDLEYWREDDSWDEDEEIDEPDTGAVLRESMHEAYSDADDEAYEDAVEAVLDGMSAAEAFGFEKALKQIQAGAGSALSQPIVGQVAGAALPVGAGALGTLIGGPAGTAIGSQLGARAAKALTPPGVQTRPPGSPPASGMPASVVPAAPIISAAAGGSAAAAQALVLTQQLPVLRALLQLSMGRHGAPRENGVPVAEVVNMLRSVVEQAAADADELAYLDDESEVPREGGCRCGGGDHGTGRPLYAAFMDAENAAYEEWS